MPAIDICDYQTKLPKYRALHKINIQFKNLTYTVKNGLFKRQKKTILKAVNGEFKSGELTALMGTSGAGKSTLLNILTGFISIGVEGEINDNGELRNKDEFAKACSYIMQDDNLFPLLKVQEAMNFAADLKLPSSIPWEEKQKRIEVILKSLGLYECRDTLSSQISGGQRRRLSIGIELIHNPDVLFLDEPTSGLDEVTAKQIVTLLHNLAREGRTVICTIHQPSASSLEMFDHVYSLVNGRCTYQGTTKGIVPYLSSFDPPLNCPKFHNPADFLLEVCAGMYGDVHEKMVQKCGNGEVSVKGMDEVQVKTEKDYEKEENERRYSEFSVGVDYNEATYATSFWHQTYAILKRVYIMISRDRQLTFYRVFLHLITGVFVGMLYFQIGDDGRYTLDNFHFLFFTTLFVMYISFCSMLVSFSQELPIITREHFNRWYSVKSYLIGVTLADLPIQLIVTFIYLIITYFMTGQPLDLFRFNIFILMLFLSGIVAQSFGMLFSSYLRLEIGVVIGPISLLPYLLFSGYFIHMKDAPGFFQWAFDLSFVRYGLEGILQGIMGFDRGKFGCPEVYCHFVNPYVFLEQIGMTENRLIIDVVALIVYYLVLKTASYFALANRIGGKK